jgi:hypothetical protein
MTLKRLKKPGKGRNKPKIKDLHVEPRALPGWENACGT